MGLSALKKWFVVLVTSVLVGLVAACGSEGSGGSTDGDGQSVTVQHALGTTKVSKDPKRIVALSFADEDALAALGITPVGYLGYQRGGQLPWHEGVIDLSASTDLDQVGANEAAEISLEQLAALQPDLILATGYWQIEQQYERLSEIAPTIGPLTTVGADSWQDSSRLVGEALGRATDMEDQISLAEQRIQAVADALPGLQGKEYVSSYYYDADNVTVGVDPEGAIAPTFAVLGMTLSAELVEAVSPQGRQVGGQPLSMERITLLDVDLLLIAYGSEQRREQLNANAAYQSLDVVTDGRVVTLDRMTSALTNNPTILSAPWFIESIRPALEKVAAAG